MAKATESLVIWVDSEWLYSPKVLELREQGHVIEDLLLHEPDAPHSEATPPDLILSKAAWNWHDDLWPHLDVVLKECRKARRVKRANTEAGPKRSNRKRPKGSAK